MSKKTDIIKEIVKESGVKGELVFDDLNEKTASYLQKLLKVIKAL